MDGIGITRVYTVIYNSLDNKGTTDILLPLASVIMKKFLTWLRAKIINNLLQEEQVSRVDVCREEGIQDL